LCLTSGYICIENYFLTEKFELKNNLRVFLKKKTLLLYEHILQGS
jgi:hypothetical protein